MGDSICMSTTTNNMETKLVTMPCNGAWQPVFPAFQHEQNTGEFRAFLCRFAVRSEFGSFHHGKWATLEDAKRFACSMSGTACAGEIEPYWYVPAFGRITY